MLSLVGAKTMPLRSRMPTRDRSCVLTTAPDAFTARRLRPSALATYVSWLPGWTADFGPEDALTLEAPLDVVDPSNRSPGVTETFFTAPPAAVPAITSGEHTRAKAARTETGRIAELFVLAAPMASQRLVGVAESLPAGSLRPV